MADGGGRKLMAVVVSAYCEDAVIDPPRIWQMSRAVAKVAFLGTVSAPTTR
jgi:hypothetical protein